MITAGSDRGRATPRLGELAQGRDNNLNLLRMAAAVAVLVSHAWPIALGDGAIQPMFRWTGMSLGSIAVQVFFVVSGFLIAASFVRSDSLLRFTLARVLRLIPGLVVSIILVGLVMGPFASTLDPVAYLTHTETWGFLVRNITLISVQYTLPGVFESNPYPTVEGSIWTLIHEVFCYVGVGIAGVCGILVRPRLATGCLIAAAFLWLTVFVGEVALPGRVLVFLELALPFGVGVTFWLWRDRIPLSAIASLVFWLIWALAFATLGFTPLTQMLFVFALAYAVFWVGYVPGGRWRLYNRLGDYSYGVYIYAFPMQGLAIWLFGSMSPLMNILIALPLTLLPSILSWHWIEKPALVQGRALGLRLAGQEKRPRQSGAAS